MAELTKRVQVLLPDAQWEALSAIATAHQQSVGHLIREAIAQVYFTNDFEQEKAEKLRMIDEMAQLNLPVADWEQMEVESTDRYEAYE